MRAAIEAAGVRVLYLPAYSPDFNLVEQIFSKLERLCRTAAARTMPELWDAIRPSFDRLTPQECRDCITSAVTASPRPDTKTAWPLLHDRTQI